MNLAFIFLIVQLQNATTNKQPINYALCIVGRDDLMGGDYWWYKNHGICTDCHSDNAYKGHTRCFDCRLKALSRNDNYRAKLTDEQREKQREYKRIYGKALYHKRKQQGICVDCGKRDAVNNVRCPICRYLNNIRRRTYKDYDV